VEDVAPAARPRAWLAWPAAVVYAGAIFVFSSIPSDRIPDSFSGADKLVHLAEYGVLGALLAIALGVGRAPGWARAALALALAAGYGVSDEWHQSFVPGRMTSFWDIAADTVGAAAGILAMRWRAGRRED
jgi:VanZ family protein